MPEPKNDKKRRPLKSLPPEGFQPKVWIIWFGLIAACAALYMVGGRMGNSGETAKLNIQQVVNLTQVNQIKSGVIEPKLAGGRDWMTISGELIQDAKLPEGLTLKPGAPKPTRFVAEGRLTDKNLEVLQHSGLYTEKQSTSWFETIGSQLLMFGVLIAVIYFLFFRQLRNAGKGAMSFGKSRAKLLTRDRDKITFAEVAGCDEAKEEVSEVVDFLKDPKKFTRMGGKIPKGILMVGPPGTGKTLLAKAVAGEADVPFFSISGSDFVEMFVGVGASRVRDMFEQGRKNAPCLIFIDEIDAVGRQRGAGLGGGNDEREQTLNSLLVEMDGFDTTEGVIIIAATNRPDVLDQALLRPGRFDRQVHVDLPDLIGREQILRVHARKISLSDDVDLNAIARGTSGLSGADLANLLNEGTLLAARRNKKRVEMVDIIDARDKVIWGRERRKLMDDEEKKSTAWHEAGHAVLQAILDDGTLPIYKATILPRGRALGFVATLPTKDIRSMSKKRLLDYICMAMGGRIAEKLVTHEISTGAAADIKQATSTARSMVCDYGMSDLGPIALGQDQDTVFLGRDITRSQHISEDTARKVDDAISQIISIQYDRAETIINEHREALDKIAQALIEYETLEGKHIMEILQHGEIKSPVINESMSKPAEKTAEPKPAPTKPASDDGGLPKTAPNPA
ncbi:ATP-dependent zinc metalloprotease FtsH [Ereboglobus luteus]|uniref:ATP-dependent zinc metalloprotease FtsH n=1 Tax=Ereboglobus luteus TaxID=1796921 RepID=A0A2U8E658_9BACT|nr:ATP-dependent zinc metalloprotease FtsH [Ereboglobus luteus]AWI10012.1 cell division protein FtsH [Ereboglobus luteus]